MEPILTETNSRTGADAATEEIAARIARLNHALDEVLAAADRPARKTRSAGARRTRAPHQKARRSGPSRTPPRRAQPAPRPRAARVLAAVLAGHRTYEQIQKATRLSADEVGLALAALIPTQIKTRHDGDVRIYFAPKRAEKGDHRRPHL